MNHIFIWLLSTSGNPFNITAQSIGVPSTTTTVSQGITEIIKLLMTVVGMLAVIFIIVGGIQMSISAGSPQRFARGRETVLYAAIGLVIAIAALAIVTFLGNAVNGGH